MTGERYRETGLAVVDDCHRMGGLRPAAGYAVSSSAHSRTWETSWRMSKGLERTRKTGRAACVSLPAWALAVRRAGIVPVYSTSWENLASQGVARKLGFQLEGVLREHFVIDGGRKDQQVWGLLRPEWGARRSEGISLAR